MASKLITPKNLMLVLSALIVIKFFVAPLLEWQSAKVSELTAKSLQFQKVSGLLSNHSRYEQEFLTLQSYLSNADEYFYSDDSDTKLVVQREVEEVFLRNELEIKGFNWTIDREGPIRVLRSKVFFSGATKNMMSTFWELSGLPRLVRQVAWEQQIKTIGGKFGVTTGNVTLEFYAWKTPKELSPYLTDIAKSTILEEGLLAKIIMDDARSRP